MDQTSRNQMKRQAKILREFLRGKHGVELSHGHALEVMSQVNGFNDWNTASALAGEADPPERPTTTSEPKTVYERPHASKLRTAGEAVDFFSSYPRETSIEVLEYKADTPSAVDSIGETIASICSLTFDSDIQSGNGIRLELQTESERKLKLGDFSKSASQVFDRTNAGRSQRRNKYLHMMTGLWNSGPRG